MKPTISTQAENLDFTIEVIPFSENYGENFYYTFCRVARSQIEFMLNQRVVNWDKVRFCAY